MWLPALAAILVPVCTTLAICYRRRIVWFYLHQFLGRLRSCLTGISREERAFRYVLTNSTHGKPESVLSTLDEWCGRYECVTSTGPEKGKILDSMVQPVAPLRALELGTYCGYAAIRIARLLPPGSKLYTVERDPKTADLAEGMMLMAGLKHTQFQVISGPPAEAIPRFKPAYGVEAFDFVFLSQGRGEYLRELRLLVEAGLLVEGSVILADGVTEPGAAGFLRSVRSDPRYGSTFHRSSAPYQEDVPDGMEELTFLKEGGLRN
ncbi:transmembrane O-methyltransferase homolog [Heptranchias perlo]|uniref:transmembrane O-methyltransferase homolog n=1 Tax=Heptranchias perlo TaxID=212740 RepID=UPI00355A5343